MNIGNLSTVKDLAGKRDGVLKRLKDIDRVSFRKEAGWVTINGPAFGKVEIIAQLDADTFAEVMGLLQAIAENERDALEQQLEALGVNFDA